MILTASLAGCVEEETYDIQVRWFVKISPIPDQEDQNWTVRVPLPWVNGWSLQQGYDALHLASHGGDANWTIVGRGSDAQLEIQGEGRVDLESFSNFPGTLAQAAQGFGGWSQDQPNPNRLEVEVREGHVNTLTLALYTVSELGCSRDHVANGQDLRVGKHLLGASSLDGFSCSS